MTTILWIPGTVGQPPRVSVINGAPTAEPLASNEDWPGFCWERISHGGDCPISIHAWILPDGAIVCPESEVVDADCSTEAPELRGLVAYGNDWCASLSEKHAIAYRSTCSAINAAETILNRNIPDCTRPTSQTDPLLDASICLVWHSGTPRPPTPVTPLEAPETPPPGYAAALMS